MPLTPTGAPAKSNDPTTWSDFATVSTSTVGVGIGFVLSDVDRIACVDLDDCLDARRRPVDWVVPILADLPPTFVEVSPSGRGLHVWGFATIDRGRRTAGIEVYGSGRYITVTGRRWRHAPATFADLDDWIATLPV